MLSFTPRPHQDRGHAAMQKFSKGQLIYPTGGGKTLNMIMDALRELSKQEPQTIVVVSPRILLSQQLCSEFLEHDIDAKVLHVHSGETPHFVTTKVSEIKRHDDTCKLMNIHQIIFTTYNSLSRLVDAEVNVDTIYFDEAHNSVKRHFFGATEYFSANAGRCYFFTATRKTSVTISKPGMNDREVYGDIICRVSAPELIDGGYIVPPKVVTKKFDLLDSKEVTEENDKNNLLNTLDDIASNKILVCVKSAKQLISVTSQTNLCSELQNRGYSYLYITAKTGAVIDGKKVTRDVFFETLNSWGKDPNKKFICLHRSILSEGVNVSELEAVIFLRNMDVIELTQTIGRVVRKGLQNKIFGLCVVPVYSKVGVTTEQALQRVVDNVFEKGDLVDSVIRR